jgi:hypothetical protein
MEEMLREFPPRTMFDYIETAKANTEVLVLFRKESPEGDDMEANYLRAYAIGAVGPVHQNRNVLVTVGRDRRRPN